MKNTARKLLALIMAMVMCLSLAAPAFAADEADAPAEASVSVQEEDTATATNVKKVVVDKTKKTVTVIGHKVNVNDNGKTQLSSTSLDADNEYLTIRKETNTKIGEAKGDVTYTITVKSDYKLDDVTFKELAANGNEVDLTVPFTIPGDGGYNSIKDVADSKWVKITNTTVENGGNSFLIEGDSYKESASTIFFRLKVAKDGKFTDEYKYFVGEAVASAMLWNDEAGKAMHDGIFADGMNVTIAAKITDPETINTTYTFKLYNPTDMANVATVTNLAVADDKETGSFEMTVERKVMKGGKEDKNASGAVTEASEAEKALKENLGTSPVEVVSVEGTNSFKVTVKKTGLDNANEDAYSSNVILVNKDKTTEAGLLDLAEDGWYNATKTDGADGKTIAKGTELLGRVAVLKTDVTGLGTKQGVTLASSNDGKYYIFETVEDAKDAFQAANCKDGKTISYKQLIMNYKNGDKTNALVALWAKNGQSALADAGLTEALKDMNDKTKVQAYKKPLYVAPVDDWATKSYTPANAAFVKTGSFEVAAAEHGATAETEEIVKAATCQEAGKKLVKTTCTVCKAVLSTKEVELPKIATSVEVNKSVKIDWEGKADAADKIVFESTKGEKAVTDHYINKVEVKTEQVSATESKKVYTYTCNLGCVHEELTRTEAVKKAELQHSGKWNLATWGTDYTILNVTKDASGTNLFGNTVEIADSDVDDETLPLNRTTPKDDVFKFATATDMKDGTFTKVSEAVTESVYSSATALPTTKNYQAVLTVKNIQTAKATCLEGSATIEVNVYELTDKYKVADKFYTETATKPDALDSKKLEENLKDGKMTLVQSFTKDVVIPATENHTYTSGATVCDRCGTTRDSALTQVITADTITVDDLTYTGKAALPKVVVRDTAGNLLIKGIDYQIGFEDENATAVGEYFVVVKGIGDYVGNRVSKTYQIVAAPAPAALKAQKIKTSAKNKTYKVKALKKKAASFTIKVSGAKGKLTWKSSNTKIATVKNGKVTVKKGAKKGTAKITVVAAKTSAYKKSNTLTIKVVVK